MRTRLKQLKQLVARAERKQLAAVRALVRASQRLATARARLATAQKAGTP